MRPPICFICRKEFSLSDGGGTVRFADYEPLPKGQVGHPDGLEWFCEEHYNRAVELKEHSSREARALFSSE